MAPCKMYFPGRRTQRAPPQLGAPWGSTTQRLPARAAHPRIRASAGRAASCTAPRSTAPSSRRLQDCNVTAPMVRLSKSYTEYRRTDGIDVSPRNLLQRFGSLVGGPAGHRSILESVRKDAAGPDAHAEAHDSYMSAVAHTGPQKRTPLQGLFDDHDSNGPPVDHQSTWAAGRLAQQCVIGW